eukprot:4586580-Heterocapsa_arctica.AAC.1
MAPTGSSMRQEGLGQAPVRLGGLVGLGEGAEIALWLSSFFVAGNTTRSAISQKAHLTPD